VYNTSFDSASDAWTGAGVSVCAGASVLGGFGVFGAGDVAVKTVSGLGPHSQLRLQLSVVAIDAWAANDTYTVAIDDNVFGPYDKTSGVYYLGDGC